MSETTSPTAATVTTADDLRVENVPGAGERTDPHTPLSSQGEPTVAIDGETDEPSAGRAEETPAEGELEAVGAQALASRVTAGTAALGDAAAEVVPDLSGLRPIGEASYGTFIGAETVHGTDDRIRIRATSSYPWSAHASLLVTARDGSRWIGTGWFIGPHTLMTAGHVVHITNSGVPGRDGFVQSVQVMPGRDESTMPFGSVTTSDLRTVVGWALGGNPDYDYGAIILPSDLGGRTGWFGFGAYSDATLTASTVNISGYPGDKPDGTQWYHWNRVASVGSRKVYYDVDTFGGQSGSAVYRISSGGRYGVAIHAYGGATTNSGTRITRPVFDNMRAWKA